MAARDRQEGGHFLCAAIPLIKQIEQGAPADIFFSADLDWMDLRQQKGLIKPETRANLLGNRIVLVAPKDSNIKVTVVPDLIWRGCLGAAGSPWAMSMPCQPENNGKAALEKLGAGTASRTRSRRPKACARRWCWCRVRSAARHRLSDRRGLRPVRQDRRRISRKRSPPIIYPIALTKGLNQSGGTSVLGLYSARPPRGRLSSARAFTVIAPGVSAREGLTGGWTLSAASGVAVLRPCGLPVALAECGV